jgi:replicative DNA helicase
MKADKLPPHSISAEQGVLGCVLQDPKTALLVCREALPEPSAFYDLRHQILYGMFIAMEDGGAPIDMLTACNWLTTRSQLERIGGVTYLSELPDRSPSAANVGYYVEIVRDKWFRRRKLAALVEAQAMVENESTELEPALDAADSLVIGANDNLGQSAVEPMSVLVPAVMDGIGRSFEHRNQGLMEGYTTRFGYLDKLTGGLRESDLWLIAGRPSTGKSSLLCSIMIQVAVECKIAFGFLSIEMRREAIVRRMLCAMSGVDLMHVQTGFLARKEFERLHAAAVRLASSPIFIDDTPSITPAQLRSKARRLVHGHGAKLLGIDHLHDVYVPEARGDERLQAVEAGMAVHWAAKSLRVPVIALAQLNRTLESESAKSRSRRPRMTDLRGSGNLEQKADLIGILWRNREDERTEDEEEASPGEETVIPMSLEIVKQRNGPVGECRLTFFKHTTKYADRYENTGSLEGLHRKQDQRESSEPRDFPFANTEVKT